MIVNRFKYFSIYYISMFYYYIKELVNIDTNIIKNLYPTLIREESLILSKDGIYKTYNNKIYKYKLISNNSERIPQFIDNYTLLVNRNNWKREIIYNIPFIHQKIQNLKCIEYKIHPKLKFIIEKIDNNVVDFYFQSNEHYDNSIIKVEIASFLSQLK